MNTANHRFRLSIAALAVLLSTVLAQGPLTPPGAPAPTMKSLDQIEPRIAINATNTPGDADSLFKITQPGSYYLTGNITGAIGKHGIEIVASGVTVDLNGFNLSGVVGMGAFDGVSVTANFLKNIAVVNGSFFAWGGEGVDLGTSLPENCRVEAVLASSNSGAGILVGNASRVTNCSAHLNNSHGIRTGAGCAVTNCSARNNTGIGINAGTGCTVVGCTGQANASWGILATTGSTVSNCSASNNTDVGIVTDDGCTVSNCSAQANTTGGITAGEGNTVTNCSAFSNSGFGIAASVGSTVTHCSAWLNTGNGIYVNAGSTVVGCSSRGNTLHGIECLGSCVIRGNTCTFNGSGGFGAGIRTGFTDNRIEGNSCMDADNGILVESTGNIIIKNTCAGNTTDWVIAANNVFGPILDRRAPASAAVSGFSAASTLGSTDPNANFSY